MIFDRLGTKTTLPIARHVQMLGPNIVERAQPHMRHHVKRLATVTAPAGGVAGIESDLARVDHELKILQGSDRAFQTTMAAAEILQELIVNHSVLDAECSKHGCKRAPWVPPPPPRSPTATPASSR